MNEWLKWLKDNDQGLAALIGIIGSLILIFVAITWTARQERAVTRRAIKAKKKGAKAVVCEVCSDAVELAVAREQITREDADYWYWQFNKIGLKEVSHEPLFGKPWAFYQTHVSPKAKNLKKAIRKRLGKDRTATRNPIPTADEIKANILKRRKPTT